MFLGWSIRRVTKSSPPKGVPAYEGNSVSATDTSKTSRPGVGFSSSKPAHVAGALLTFDSDRLPVRTTDYVLRAE